MKKKELKLRKKWLDAMDRVGTPWQSFEEWSKVYEEKKNHKRSPIIYYGYNTKSK